MSAAVGPFPITEVDISNSAQQRTIHEHYAMDDDHGTIAPGAGVPELPQKSTFRGSRILDNHGLKLGGAVEESGKGATTPHDIYLSSEEDASSDADDFSDYDYDSSVEDPESPTRASHEVTARVVSVVFAGKPSIVDLSVSKKRSISLSLSCTRTSTESIAKSDTMTSPPPEPSTGERPITPASSTSSNNNRRSSLLSDILAKKKPPFLSIDPYANGSSYALDIPKALDSLESESPAKTPRTPTQILKGVTRSFSLVRKRSRPALSQIPKVDTSVAVPRASTSSSLSKRSSLQQSMYMSDEEKQQQEKGEDKDMAKTPQTPITYNDILKAVKKNSMMMPPPSDVLSPTSPNTDKTNKRGILSGLAARRRSVKLVGRQWP